MNDKKEANMLMIRKMCIGVLACLPIMSTFAQIPQLAKSWTGIYNDEQKISLFFQQNGAQLSGYSLLNGKATNFTGTVKDSGQVVLKEQGNGNAIGTFKFQHQKGAMEGSWQSANNVVKPKFFTVTAQQCGYVKNKGEFLEVSQRLLKDADLQVPLGQLQYMRNEVYARHGYAFSAKDYKKTGIPIVTMGNINLGGYFYFSESKSNFWIEDKSLERYEIKKGDLIIAMTDVTPEKNLIGLTSIIDIDRIFYLNQRVGHIILKPKLADTDFIFYLSQNSYWRNQCKAFATLGVQANLGTNDIKNINIKLPPLEEQTAIAEILATADRELQLQKEKLAQLQTQKKGLMQVLLTGKKRLIN